MFTCDVNVLTFLFALTREHGVFAALHAAPYFRVTPEDRAQVHVAVNPYGPLTEAAAAELAERLQEAYKARPERLARLGAK